MRGDTGLDKNMLVKNMEKSGKITKTLQKMECMRKEQVLRISCIMHLFVLLLPEAGAKFRNYFLNGSQLQVEVC